MRNFKVYYSFVAVGTVLTLLPTDSIAQRSPTTPARQNSSATDTTPSVTNPAPVETAKLGNTKNVHQVGNLYLSGQFELGDLTEIQSAGVKRVITLRNDGEIDWDEKAAVETGGMKFRQLGFREPETLTPTVFEKACELLNEADGKTLLHCGSANRVGAVWLTHRVLNEGVPLERAVQEAVTIGLKTPEYEQRAIEYIKSKKPGAVPEDYQLATKEVSVRPGINDNFLAPDLDPEEWTTRFEIESREIYAARAEVLRACKIKPGSMIADIGAGTGIYTRLFANHAGSKGWVFAVDISPRLIQHINEQSFAQNQSNVSAILCQQNSTNLPPASIDFAFICDTYHHFEFPKSTLASLHSALRPGGRIVVVDFKRIEGESRPWTMEHVRGGQKVFTAEIEAAGFKLLGESTIPGFKENYFLTFERN